jgi:hypothetical protein
MGDIFGIEFVVKYGHATHEILVCCHQHGALVPFCAVGEFSTVSITVSEPLCSRLLQLAPSRGDTLRHHDRGLIFIAGKHATRSFISMFTRFAPS